MGSESGHAVFLLDGDGRVATWNEAAAALTGYERDAVRGTHVAALFVVEDRLAERPEQLVADAVDRGQVVDEGQLVRADGTTLTVRRIVTALDDSEPDGFAVAVNDLGEREARGAELQRQRDELRELDRLNTIIRAIDQALVAARTREDVETTVVEHLAATDAYEGAVIGDFTASFDAFTARAWAGFDEPEAYFPAGDADAPAVSAVRSRSPRTARDLRADADDETAPSDGDLTAMFVPLVEQTRGYGVLGVYRTTSFGERERQVLTELGRTIAHAIHAVDVQRLLTAESVLEVELRIPGGSVLADLSADTDARVTLDTYVSASGDQCLTYVTVAGSDREGVEDALDAHAAVDRWRVVETSPDAVSLELATADPTVVSVLANFGAKVAGAVAEGGGLRVTVEVRPGTDVRRLVETVGERYPETELVGRREVDRSVETRGAFRATVFEEMTEKQRTALETAFYGGYFAWPRRASSASEVADTLGVARQTFQQHLRVAQRKLLSALFDGPP